MVKEENVKVEIPGYLQTYEYIENDPRAGRSAEMVDFLQTVIMYSIGGVYRDTDIIFCDSIDFLVNAPRMVSFPAHVENCAKVNGYMMSAPPHHKLILRALQYFIGQREGITKKGNSYAAESYAFGIATDAYIKDTGINIPPLHE